MMRGRVYMDGVDIFERFGVFVAVGGWNELVAIPPLKSVKYNDWHEEDGIEPDLENVALDSRTATIRFFASGDDAKTRVFFSALKSKPLHEFDCRSIGRKFRLRMASNQSVVWANGVAPFDFSIKFTDHFPLLGYVYREPSSDLADDLAWTIDGKPLTRYGCRVLRGSVASFAKLPDVKQNLTLSDDRRNGAQYDDSFVSFDKMDAKMECLMTANSLGALWRNFDALAFDLSRPNERRIISSAIGREFRGFYKSCKVSEFFNNGEIWLKFAITFTLFGGFL